MQIPPTGSIQKACFHPPTDLIFAVIADVVHAHEDGQKFPVRLEVEALEQEKAEGLGRCLGFCQQQLGGVLPYLITSQRVYQMSGLAGEVATIRSLEQSVHKKVENSQSQSPEGAAHKVLCPVTARLNPVSLM